MERVHFHVAVQRHPTTRMGWQLVPEFHVSQDVSRAEVLYLIRERLGCGESGRTTAAHETPHWCSSCVAEDDLLNKVIPFFEAQPLISGKQQEFVDLRRASFARCRRGSISMQLGSFA